MEGIVNGTTNFMLTKMIHENLGFDEALKIAQELGYAETKDPGDDVDGRDACRKIAILSSLVCGHQIYPQNIPTRASARSPSPMWRRRRSWAASSSSSPG